MTKTLLKYEALEDENGDLIICLSGATEKQKQEITGALAIALTKVGDSFDFIKDQGVQKSWATLKVIEMVKNSDKKGIADYLRENYENPTDARAFAYAWTRFEEGSKSWDDLLEFDMLTDEAWEERIKQEGIPEKVKNYFDKKALEEDGFRDVSSEEIPFSESINEDIPVDPAPVEKTETEEEIVAKEEIEEDLSCFA